MRKLFLRALLFSAVTQFIVTRNRAGRVEEEGAAATLWVLYPANVLASALVWTLMLSTLGRVTRVFRRGT
jgi:hypothetical protein